jgi:hypothetical protein
VRTRSARHGIDLAGRSLIFNQEVYMKFNIEVELDYIDEEGCLDDAIKNSILASVTKIVMEKVSKQVDAKLDKIIIQAAEKKARQIVNRIANNFTTRKFDRKDEYGDVIEVDLTVKDILKREFDHFWNTTVDKDGREAGYGEKMTRIEWTIEKHIKEHSKKFAETITKDTENKIKTTPTRSVKN